MNDIDLPETASGKASAVLIREALRLGATAAAIIPASQIVVQDDLAQLCRQPRCSNYGLSLSCPPHVAGPRHFRKLQHDFRDAMVVKIDVPTEILLSSERLDIMELLHGVVSGVESLAKATGCADAVGFAGSSCKQLFCRTHDACRALAQGGICRNPDLARPSMSGFGINVAKLMQAAGWSGETITREGEAGQADMAWVAGLVLIR